MVGGAASPGAGPRSTAAFALAVAARVGEAAPGGNVEDWLATPPELGGRRYGPLPDVVSIGTDPQRCDLVLALRTGLPGVAVQLQRQQSGWVLSLPGGDAPDVTLRRSDEAGPARPTRSGARLAPGDTLVVGTAPPIALTLLRATGAGLPAPDDPARLVPVDISPRARAPAPAPAPGAPAAPATTGPWAAEARRQAEAQVLARSGFAARLDAWARWLRTGGWRSPVVLVPAVLALLTGLTGVTAGAAWLVSSWLR